jgi:hypothetical protein
MDRNGEEEEAEEEATGRGGEACVKADTGTPQSLDLEGDFDGDFVDDEVAVAGRDVGAVTACCRLTEMVPVLNCGGWKSCSFDASFCGFSSPSASSFGAFCCDRRSANISDVDVDEGAETDVLSCPFLIRTGTIFFSARVFQDFMECRLFWNYVFRII